MKTTKGLEWYLEHGGDPIHTLLDHQYKERVFETMCQAIRFKFPEITNLNYDVDKEIISFDAGVYTKEEVGEFINQFRRQSHNDEGNS